MNSDLPVAMDGANVIGELRFHFGRRMVSATLTNALRWQCNEKVLEDYLNDTLGTEEQAQRRNYAPVYYLYQAGERLGAEVRPSRPAMTLSGAAI